MNHSTSHAVRTALTLLSAIGLTLLIAATSAWAADDVKQIEKQYGVLGRGTEEGRRLNEQLERAADRIVAAVNAENPERGFQIKKAKILGGKSEKGDRMVNAFALPDGRIYVTLGLLRAIRAAEDSDDELGFVVGHEVTHVVERHAVQQQKKALPAAVVAILLSAVTRKKAVGDLAQAGAAAHTSHYSREDEYRADRGSLKAMVRAGYEPQAAVVMLQRLEKLGGEQSKLINGWFGSHPLTENRIARIKAMIVELPAGGDAAPGPDRPANP